jgi:hypothetical protein
MEDKKYLKLEFHYCSLSIGSYAGDDESQTRLLKDIVQSFSRDDVPDDLKIIDKLKGRKVNRKRKLVQISAKFGKGGKRCFGRIALIKNKAPQFWSTGADIVEAIEKPDNKEFIEVTNYIIDFTPVSEPIIMVEFNDAGPRISDIEYYFRQYSTHYKIAKSIKAKLHVETDFKDLDRQLQNVYELYIKVPSSKFIYNKEKWFGSLKALSEETGYKDVIVKLYYGYQKDKVGDYKKNSRGLDFARKILSWLKKDHHNLENIDALKMKYQSDYSDKIIDLDFFKNKRTSYLKIPDYNGYFKRSEFETLSGLELSYYMKNGVTNNYFDVEFEDTEI